MATMFVLGIVNWLHLMATVLWIGAMAANLFVVMPSAMKALEPSAMGKLMGEIMRRFRFIVYISIILLVATGAAMTVLNENYRGFLKFESLWTIFSLSKHAAVAILVILAIYALEGLAPRVARMAAQGPSPALALLQKRQMLFAFTGFALGLVILLLTGIMTSISSLS